VIEARLVRVGGFARGSEHGTRLLSLKLLRYDHQPHRDQGYYHWAHQWPHLGKLVLRLLKFSDLLAVKKE
jgi:hypothetical protein